jgi:hypothetical protein
MKALKQLFTSILCALLLFNTSFTFAGSESGDFSYTVKKNDTIWAICKIYVSDPLCWKKLVKYNQVKIPKYLSPKSIIRIPKTWLKNYSTTALVIAVEGQVNVVREGNQEQKSLVVGDLLSQEDVVQALNGTAMIKFADESRLLLKANSTIRMASLQFYDASQLVNTRVELLKGRVKALVEKISNKNSRYEIATPAAVAAVRGTEFRVANEKDGNGNTVMKTELLTGALAIISDKNNKNIVPGQAVMAVEGEGVFEPVNLLSRPLLEINGARSFRLPYNLQWKPLEGAVSYKIILIADGNELWEKSTKDTQLTLQNLAVGRFELLIRGVDSQGFEGRDRRLKINLP